MWEYFVWFRSRYVSCLSGNSGFILLACHFLELSHYLTLSTKWRSSALSSRITWQLEWYWKTKSTCNERQWNFARNFARNCCLTVMCLHSNVYLLAHANTCFWGQEVDMGYDILAFYSTLFLSTSQDLTFRHEWACFIAWPSLAKNKLFKKAEVKEVFSLQVFKM